MTSEAVSNCRPCTDGRAPLAFSCRERTIEDVEVGGDGRSDRIRTCDVLLPKQVLYQAELRSDEVRTLSQNAGTAQ